jgi:preprotein translocase subunit SecG
MEITDVLYVLTIFISVFLTFVILLQVKGSGFGQALGGADTSYRTRRGLEKTLMQLTIVLVSLFVLVATLSARAT